MKNMIQMGRTLTLPLAPYARASGEGCLLGLIFGVACHAALISTPIEVETEGVFELKKTSAQAWATLGLAIYWDDTNKECTTTSAGNTKIGVNVATAANPTATGLVRLNGVF